MKWQPIKTAPKDGTLLLLYLAEDIERKYASPAKAARYCIGFFGATDSDYGVRNTWCSVESLEEMWGMGGEYTGPMFSTDCIMVKPSHWMPLPEPPER